MKKYWQKICYVPDNSDLGDIEDTEDDVSGDQVNNRPKANFDIPESQFSDKYNEIKIDGFKKDQKIDQIYQVLLESGLPDTVQVEDLVRDPKRGYIYISDLTPDVCTHMQKLSNQELLGRKVWITPLVPMTPPKSSSPPITVPDQNSCSFK